MINFSFFVDLFVSDTATYSASPNLLITTKPPVAPPHYCPESKKNTATILQMKRRYRLAVQLIKRMGNLQKKQAQQNKSFSIQISELSSEIVQLKRRLEESDTKNRDQSGNSKTSNIKPRMATIILKRRITEPSRSILSTSPKKLRSQSSEED